MSISAQAASDTTPQFDMIGASITEQWHVDRISERLGDFPARIQPLVSYEFDKQALVERVIAAPVRPRAVIIKECGAYFPGNETEYQRLIQQWVTQLRAVGIEPILATTIPVTASLPTWIMMKQWVKHYVLWRDDYIDNTARLTAIRRYNRWLRQYAADTHTRLWDLEQLMGGGPDNALPDDLSSGDGLHLNAAAYRRMDLAMADLVKLVLSPA